MSDPSGTIAPPLPTLTRRAGKRPPFRRSPNWYGEHEVAEIVIGLPLALSGEETDWTAEVRDFGAKLAQRTGVSVSYVDERMTSVQAEKTVRSLGLKRGEREQKTRVDAAAALLILQAYLDRRPRA